MTSIKVKKLKPRRAKGKNPQKNVAKLKTHAALTGGLTRRFNRYLNSARTLANFQDGIDKIKIDMEVTAQW